MEQVSMPEIILLQLSIILIAGILAQWIAWQLELPAILTLLVCGIILGPVLNIVNPDALFGSILLPFVSLAVALILFEGGLNLKFKELSGIGNIFYRLISIGVFITFLVALLAAHLVLHLTLQTSAMIGAILVVTGPTVIIPILRQIHLKKDLNSLLKWEGIFIDPLGAVFAVLVYEVIQLTQIRDATPVIIFAIIKTLLVGGCVGFSMASLLIGLMYKRRLPDFLHIPVTLMFVISAFVASNMIQTEAGLLATTVMGLVLANQKWVSVKHILEFKENLGVLLISLLFIVLAARLKFEEFFKIGWEGLIFLGILILIARPFSVILSTVGSKLNWRGRGFISWMAPRGIIAAAVAVIFQERMQSLGIADADRIAPLVFLVIIVTVILYGFSALPLAKGLGLTIGHSNGVLIIGAHSWARQIASALHDHSIPVLLIDTNIQNVKSAHNEGLPAYAGSVLSDEFRENESLHKEMGHLLALTGNDEVNTLAFLNYQDIFRENRYQLALHDGQVSRDLHGHIAFGMDVTYGHIEKLFSVGGVVESIELKGIDHADLKTVYNMLLPLFLIDFENRLKIYNPEVPSLNGYKTLIYLRAYE
jgi:NhaP-type Na+/H+ or K+/H+ antiporter